MATTDRNEEQRRASHKTAQQYILTLEEAAEILRCSKTHVSNALNGKIPGTPRLPHFSMGRRKLIRREWLEQWMESNKSK